MLTDGLSEFAQVLRRFASKDGVGRNDRVRGNHGVIQYFAVVFDDDAVANNAPLANVDVAANGLRTDYAGRFNGHIVANFHCNVLQMALLLVESRSQNGALFNHHVRAKLNGGHVASEKHFCVHNVFAFHPNVVHAFQDHILTNFVLLLRKDIELRFVVARRGLHYILNFK